MPSADGTRRKWLAFFVCACAWGLACLWAALRGWSMFTAITVIAIAGVLPVLFWLDDSLHHRSGATVGAYANLVLCFVNGTVAVLSWEGRKWLGGVAFTVLSIVFTIWWFQSKRQDATDGRDLS